MAERGGNRFENVGFGVEKQGVWDCVVAEMVVECGVFGVRKRGFGAVIWRELCVKGRLAVGVRRNLVVI